MNVGDVVEVKPTSIYAQVLGLGEVIGCRGVIQEIRDKRDFPLVADFMCRVTIEGHPCPKPFDDTYLTDWVILGQDLQVIDLSPEDLTTAGLEEA